MAVSESYCEVVLEQLERVTPVTGVILSRVHPETTDGWRRGMTVDLHQIGRPPEEVLWLDETVTLNGLHDL